MSTNFNNSETLPPKLRFKLTQKTELEKNSEPSSPPGDDVDDLNWISNIPFCKTYYPTEDEFQDPMAYLEKITAKASKFGICKIVPPISTSVPAAVVLEQISEPRKFPAEYLPLQTGFTEGPPYLSGNYTMEQFQKSADKFYTDKYHIAAQLPPSLMEEDFWRSVSRKDRETTQQIKCIKTTAFPSDPLDPLASTDWNLKYFARLLQSPLRFLNQEKEEIKEVVDPKVSMGMLWSYTYWHAEPGHLYRIEYHHCGAPRTWYASPNTHTYHFERVAKEFVFPQEDLQIFEAFDLLNLKRLLFSPSVMVKHNVPIYKTLQYPGEFVVKFPRSYHMNFSHGFNCWESVNFATHHWFEFGDEASDRRALYSRSQDIPFQELLLKEFMNLYETDESMFNFPSYRSMKVTFMCLIRMHRYAIDKMKKSVGIKCSLTENGSDTFSCGACRRECYMAYVQCDCFPYPLCIFHNIYKKCRCGDLRLMVVREEFLKLEGIAKKFEADEANTDVFETDEVAKNDKRKTLMQEVYELYDIKFVAFNNDLTLPEEEEVGKAQRKGKKVGVRVPKSSRAGPLAIRDPDKNKDDLSMHIPRKPRTR